MKTESVCKDSGGILRKSMTVESVCKDSGGVGELMRAELVYEDDVLNVEVISYLGRAEEKLRAPPAMLVQLPQLGYRSKFSELTSINICGGMSYHTSSFNAHFNIA